MSGHSKVLVVGTSEEELWCLFDAATRVIDPAATSLGLVTTLDSIDTDLAWGVKQLETHSLSRTDKRMGPPIEEPLGADGDTWRAIVDAAHRHRCDLVVIATRNTGWLHRIFSGSAVQDLLKHADLPILAIPEPAICTE